MANIGSDNNSDGTITVNCCSDEGTVEQCLTEQDLDMIRLHFSGKLKLDQDVISSFCPHIQKCASCSRKLEESRPIAHAGIEMMMQQECLHTSYPPNRCDQVFKPDRLGVIIGA